MADYKDMLKETLNNLGEKAKDITENAAEMAREYAGSASDFAKDFKENAQEKAREYAGAAAEKAKDFSDAANERAKNFTDGDPAGFLRNINAHMPTASENRLIFIEKTGHTYQMKHQEVAEAVRAIRKDFDL